MQTTFNVHYTLQGRDLCMAVKANDPDGARDAVRTMNKGVTVIINKVKVDRSEN